MQLYFIRHGQSANNLLYERAQNGDDRSADPELTEYGRRQARLAGEFLAGNSGLAPATRDAWVQNVDGFGLTHLYSSPMIRAMDTAQAIAGAVGLTPSVWVDLHEEGGMWLKNPDTGEPEGLPGPNRAFFKARYPNFVLPENLDGAGWWNRPFETSEACAERAGRLLRNLEARHHNPDDRVAVVSHGGFYNALLSVLLGRQFRDGVWFSINNVALTRIDLFERNEWGNSTRLAYQNRVDFLPPELIT